VQAVQEDAPIPVPPLRLFGTQEAIGAQVEFQRLLLVNRVGLKAKLLQRPAEIRT
jgi:hypothetical protein